MMMFEIIDIDVEFEECAKVIRESFITVATEFGITKKNAPTNPAFIESNTLAKMKEEGVRMYGGYIEDKIIAFVALEKASDDSYYLEKLCVVPEYRHNSYGEQLIQYIFATVKGLGGKKVSIGIINDNIVLKNWYIKNGFNEIGRKVFEHLPFEVCFMEKLI
ncbi:MAG: GNAT family N-acetyltransferase [Clostridiales bacterium]|nr:GNAT family N-acetyltransferase [Clostridiales bacterium]